MKIWSKYIPNEWIVLAPIIIICAILNESVESEFWNNVYYYIEIVSASILAIIVLIRVFFACKNQIKSWKNSK